MLLGFFYYYVFKHESIIKLMDEQRMPQAYFLCAYFTYHGRVNYDFS